MPKDEGPVEKITDDQLIELAGVPQYLEVYTWKRLENDTDLKVKKKIRIAPMTYKVCCQVSAEIKTIANHVLLERFRYSDIPELIVTNGPNVSAIVSFATDESTEYLESLPGDQFLEVARKVFKVNIDFFVLRLSPILNDMGKIMADGIGLTFSTISKPTDMTPLT